MIVYTLRTTERHLKETLRPVERGTRSIPEGPECGCPDKAVPGDTLLSFAGASLKGGCHTGFDLRRVSLHEAPNSNLQRFGGLYIYTLKVLEPA